MASIKQAVAALKMGDVIAYPTEGVFGLGCDPDNKQAIQRLLDIKERPQKKGVILIAASIQQLSPYIDLSLLSEEQRCEMERSWPGPFTWVVPKGKKATSFISGQFDSIAVRVSDYPDVRALCEAFGKPITSTSANLSGMSPCITYKEVQDELGDLVATILEGKVGQLDGPTQIRDAITGKYLRN